jgi:hypothetical protein
MPDMKDEMLGIREVLQSVEDALIDHGWDEISVRTDHGMFTWMTDKRAGGDRRGRRRAGSARVLAATDVIKGRKA